MIPDLQNVPPRRLFLIDCIGALISTIFLGLVLTTFQAYIGMPLEVLYFLSYAAAGFCLYSLICFAFFPGFWSVLLKAIATINTIYSCITLVLLFKYFDDLLILGYLYFIGELLILAVLIRAEWKVAKRKFIA